MKQHKRYDHYVDVIGLDCPQPVINCKATLAKMAKGEILTFTASDRSSLGEIPRLVESLGDELINVCESASHYRFTIKRKSTPGKSQRSSASLLEITGLSALAQLMRSGELLGTC